MGLPKISAVRPQFTMKKSKSAQDSLKPLKTSWHNFTVYPWIFFFLFFLLNAWMSWITASLNTKLLVFTFVFIPLFLLMVGARNKAAVQPPWEREIFSAIPSWALGLLFLLAFGVRLYKLTTLSFWPEVDEGSMGYYASQMAAKWRWDFFFGFNYISPGPIWLLALFFKAFPPSLLTLWFFPVLVSMGTMGVGYWACRQFFSRSFSLLWAWGWAFSFWPLYVSRFDIPPILVPFWECLALLILGF